MKSKHFLIYYICFLFVGAITFSFGYLVRSLQEENYKTEFPVFEEAFNILENHAFDELPQKTKIEYSMINGMMDAYGDPFSRFEEPAQHEISTDRLEGRYGGIGANLEFNQNGLILIHPFEGGPADEVGIQDGDIIVSIDGNKIFPDTPLNEVVAALRGPEGHPVNIGIIREPKTETLIFTVIRIDYPIPSVTWNLIPGISWLGILNINIIASNTIDQIHLAFDDLISRGATHFILDLRDNRGGLLNSGVDISRLFLDFGIIIKEKSRDRNVTIYEVNKPGPYTDIPLIVLVNNNTASAAEIIAGSLKVNHRAMIIGTPTYGKDTIQHIFELQDQSSLHITTSKWWIPGLTPTIGQNGIQPDIEITSLDTKPDPFIQSSIEYFQSP